MASGQLGRLAGVLQQALTAGNGGHPHPLHGDLGGGLVAHRTDRLGGGAHKDEAVVGADLGEAVILGQEAVAGVDGIGAAGGGGRQDVGNVQVALRAGRLTHAHGLIGQLHMQGVAVHGAVNRHGGNAEFPTGAQDAEGDLAAVGDQHFADGHPPQLSLYRPGRTVSALTAASPAGSGRSVRYCAGPMGPWARRPTGWAWPNRCIKRMWWNW